MSEPEPRQVNDRPGALLHDARGGVPGATAPDMAGGRIQAIRSVLNPDKSRHLGPVGDAWALAGKAGEPTG